MKKKALPRLTLNRETIQRLDETTLDRVAAGDPPSSQWICCPDPVYAQNPRVK
jgi:hypothetical protein